MGTKDGPGVWKWVCGVQSAVMVTGLAAWLSFGGGVTRAEAREMIRTYAPYAADKAIIMKALTQHEERVRSLEAMQKDQTALNHKMDKRITVIENNAN
jgi:hypothetical protein